MTKREDTFNPLRSSIRAPCPYCEFSYAIPAGFLKAEEYQCMRCGKYHHANRKV